MGLPRPLDELIEIARRDDWHQILVGSDLRQILGEVQRLQKIDRERLVDKARIWKDRLGSLDMMAAEMVTTQGAWPLLAKAKAANLAINQLDEALDRAIAGRVVGVVGEIDMWCRSKAEWISVHIGSEIYRVPTGKGIQTEQLGTVTQNMDRWDWCRHRSEVHDWNCTSGGTEGTLILAKDKVLEGWDKEATVEATVEETQTARWARWAPSADKGEDYLVRTASGTTKSLGTVSPQGDKWNWSRYKSMVKKWRGPASGMTDTRKEAKAKIMEGWG